MEKLSQDWKPKSSLTMITTAVMLATFVEVLNTSIANVALKYIAGSFSISNDESLWIVDYLFSSSYVSGGTSSVNYSFGYWLLSSNPGSSYYSQSVNYDSYINSGNTDNGSYGIRPVITVLKAELLRAME